MASTYSPNLALTLIGTGDQAGAWGNTTNVNLGTLLEQAISGYVTQIIADVGDTTITIPNGATGVARNMAIECTGALTAARNLLVPSNKKLYVIYNNTTGGYAVTVKVAGQTGVSVPNGKKMILVCDGTDIVNAVNYLSGNITGTAANITGIAAVANGGTGLSTIPTNGQLLIGNGSGYSVANLNAGANVTITNSVGGITISSSGGGGGGGGTVTSVDMTVPSFLSVSGNPITGAGTLAVSYSGTALPVPNGGTGATTLTGYVKGNGASAMTAASTIPGSDISGDISGNAASLSTTLITSKGGTGQTTYTQGQVLIGNSSGTLTKNTITAGSGISITNGDGAITIASTGGGSGTVTSVGGTGTVNGITLTGTVTSTGNLTLGGTLSGVSLTTQVSGTLPIANGGTGQTTAANAINALLPSQTSQSGKFLTTNGSIASWGTAGTGTVTSVGGTGTVNGITLTGTVTSTGNLTLGGTLSGVSLTTQVSGTLPVANGGTGLTSFTSGGAVYASSTSVLTTGTLPVASGGTGVTTSTGSGSNVLSTSPSLTTPVLGTPTSGNLSNCTADGTNAVGYRNVPQSGTSKTAPYTLATSDVGKFIQVGSGGSITIPNSTFAAGDVVSVFNNTSGSVTVTCSTTNCYIAGIDTNKTSVTLATRGVVTILFVTSTLSVLTGNVS
jgi:hypothetical protein